MPTQDIAMFPLQVLLLPGESVDLYIFEPRYRQLVADWEETQMPFAIPYARAGLLTGYGCVVEISKIRSHNNDGTYNIEITGKELFRLEAYQKTLGDRLYPGGRIKIIERENFYPVGKELENMLQEFLDMHPRRLAETLYHPDFDLLDAARMVKLGEAEKLKLISAKQLFIARKVLADHIRFELALKAQEGSRQGSIFLN